MSRESIGNFELMVLLAVLRLDEEAYGVPVADEVERALGREVAAASVYAALERLTRKGLVTFRLGESTPERGGRARKYFTVTPLGIREARVAQSALTTLWRGLPALRGEPA